MRKLFSFLLVICLMFLAIPTTSSAADVEERASNGFKNELKVIHLGHGEYKICKESDLDAGTEIATLVEEEGVYQLDDGTYLSYIDEKTLLRVKRLNVQLIDQASIKNILEAYNFDDAVKRDICKRSEDAIKSNNTQAAVTMYTAATPKQIAGVGTMAMQTTYYVYQGRNFKEDLIYYTTIETTWKDVEKGIKATAVAGALYTYGMKAVGAVSKTLAPAVALFDEAKSALETFIDLIGYSPIGGEYEDKIQINVRYDVNTKYTYVESGGQYLLGAVTQRVYVHFVDTYQYYVTNSGGRSTTERKYDYTTYQTPNDANPKDKALYWFGNPWTEYVNFTVHDKSISF